MRSNLSCTVSGVRAAAGGAGAPGAMVVGIAGVGGIADVAVGAGTSEPGAVEETGDVEGNGVDAGAVDASAPAAAPNRGPECP